MKKLFKQHWSLLLAVIAVPVGNRIFNHVNAWIGIAIILTAFIYLIYKLLKNLNNETEN